MEMMELQEQIDGAAADPDKARLATLAAELRMRLDQMVDGLGELFGRIGADAACEAVRQSTLAEIRQDLNAISYVRRLLKLSEAGRAAPTR